jgi:uncharacterized membrane protein YvbJ
MARNHGTHSRFTTPPVCPVCGADVPAGAKSCPDCGACEKTGWSDDAASDGLDLPDDEFDYGRFVAEEFGKGPRKSGRQMLWTVVAIVVVIAFLLLLFGQR